MTYISEDAANNQQQFVNPEREGWKSKAAALATWVTDHMVVRTDTYGYYRPEPARSFAPLQRKDLIAHFSGWGDPVGLYSTEPDGDTAKWACVEIDNHGDRDPEETWQAAQDIYRRGRGLGLTPLLEASNGKGGYHLWFLFGSAVAARLLRALGLWLVKDAPFPIEVFPKQDGVAGRFGNYVRLPGRHHKDRRYWSKVWGGETWLAGRGAAEYVLAFRPAAPDLIPTEALAFKPPRAAYQPRPDAKHTFADDANWLADFDGDLRTLDVEELFSDHNLYVQDLGAGQHAVTCPWADEHTTGTSGTSVWVRAGGYPAFNCLHAHCQDRMVDGTLVAKRTLKDVCAHFGPDVIDRYCLRDFAADLGEKGERASERCKAAPSPDNQTNERKKDNMAMSTYEFRPMTAKEFDESTWDMSWLVENMMVAQQPAMVGGPKKSLKTAALIDLTVSLGSGTPFLGRFNVPKAVRTVMISGESGGAVIKETARRVCAARGIRLTDTYSDWDFRLPRIAVAEELRKLAVGLSKMKAEVVIIDPLYLCLLAGSDKSASNLYDMGPLLMEVANACLDGGATPILAHHTRKNTANQSQYEAMELEDLAFAGVQEFARQWLLLNRRVKYVHGSGFHQMWMSVGGSAGHSGLWGVDVNEGQLKGDFTGRKWDVHILNMDDVKKEKTAMQASAKDTKLYQADYDTTNRMLKIVKDWPDDGPKRSANQVRVRMGCSVPKFNRVFNVALDDKLIRDNEDVVSLTSTGKQRLTQ